MKTKKFLAEAPERLEAVLKAHAQYILAAEIGGDKWDYKEMKEQYEKLLENFNKQLRHAAANYKE